MELLFFQSGAGMSFGAYLAVCMVQFLEHSELFYVEQDDDDWRNHPMDSIFGGKMWDQNFWRQNPMCAQNSRIFNLKSLHIV